MDNRNKRWAASSAAVSILFSIGAVRFYSDGDITGGLIYGAAGLAFLFIAFGQIRKP
ncbi:MAG: hypothetical protein J7K66_05505 [Anaerolineaceae bacterium]|nr:hypothetical protein [Anaerolineaceae bacterium]